MKIVVAGGTGFLGTPLVSHLRAGGDDVSVLTRGRAAPGQITWSPDGTAGPWATAIDGADAVINLAGESIAGRRWTAAHKARIRDSRILATRSIVTAIHAATRKPLMLLNASAVGYYGSRGDETLTEESGPGDDFLAMVCRAWEAEAMAAADASRVIVLRSAPVLESDGGVLRQMAMPFRFFVGGPIGHGRQYWAWIHRDDWVAAVKWALDEKQQLGGPLNLASPTPVTNKEFAAALGRALKRPAFMPTPSLALRLVLGEMADVLLFSQRVIPAKALALGYQFRYADLHTALAAAFRRAD
jgi:uncharacterized protein (TIGR01777 family)